MRTERGGNHLVGVETFGDCTFKADVSMKMTCLLESPQQWWALVLSFVTSTVVFARRALVLNRYQSVFSTLGVITWIISLMSGLLFWLTLNALTANVAIQLTTGILSTTVAWLVYVLLINGRLQYPTKQQWISLLFHVGTEALILLQVRIVVDSASKECVLD